MVDLGIDFNRACIVACNLAGNRCLVPGHCRRTSDRSIRRSDYSDILLQASLAAEGPSRFQVPGAFSPSVSMFSGINQVDAFVVGAK